MNADQWPLVKELFHAALERDASERSAFLDAACHDDLALRAEIDRLLTAHAQSESFIERPALGGARPVLPATMTGRVIGRYEIGRLIGAGGMGEVYAARDTELGREVAFKIAAGDDAEAQARLRREAQHASHLNHPHVCTIHEVGAFDGRSYIVMEYVKGQRLSDIVQPDGLPINTMLRYATQLADALAHAHHHGVTHGDLKSANIVITPDGRAKVLDFGLARRLPEQRLNDLTQSRESLTAEGVVTGTLSYMAPELLRGEPADARSDIWALGVLLYEMAAGTRPFAGETGFELSAAILHEPPPPLAARIPASFKQIAERCLAKDPRQRYEHADEIRSALEAVPTPHAAGMSRRSRQVAVVMLAVALLLGIGVARTWWIGPASSPVAVGASGRPAIAVLAFANVKGDQNRDIAWLSSGVPSMLLTGLAQTRGLEIVSPQRLHDAARQMGEPNVDSLDKSRSAEVARRAGAGAVVQGNIFRAGDQIRIEAQLEDLSTGRILAAASVQGTDVFALVDRLAARIRDGAGFRDATGIRSVAEISSASLEAQRLYAIGTEAAANHRLEDARKSLEAAVAIDPAFGDAHYRLAFVYAGTGRNSEYRAILRKAAEHADHLNERDRLLLKMQAAREANDLPEVARLLDEVLSKFPEVDFAYVIAVALYHPTMGALQNPEKLLAILRGGTIALPSSTVVRNAYGYVLLGIGRYADAIREFETYTRLAPREPNPYDSLGEASLVMGYPEKAIEHYSRALTIDPTFTAAHNGRAWSLAALARYDEAIAENPPLPNIKALLLSRVGRYREAAQVIAAGLIRAESGADPGDAGALSLLSATLALERKGNIQALKDTQSAARFVAPLPAGQKRGFLVAVDLFSGAAEARLGRLDAARSRLDSQTRGYRPTSAPEHWWHSALEGEIALAGGDVQKAAAAFAAGEPSTKWFTMSFGFTSVLANNVLFRDGPARVAIARGDLKGAIEMYRQLLRYGPEQKWVSMFEPRYVLEIARLLDRTGDKQTARQEYERFLNFWKNADPGLPELGEARRAVARISAPVRATP